MKRQLFFCYKNLRQKFPKNYKKRSKYLFKIEKNNGFRRSFLILENFQEECSCLNLKILGKKFSKNCRKFLKNIIENGFLIIYFAERYVPACKLPNLPISNPEILKFIHGVSPIVCSPKDWVVVNGSVARIDEKIQSQYGTVTCAFAGLQDSFKTSIFDICLL